MRRFRLDLLAQPVNVSLQRVGRDRRIIPPDLVQELVPRHRLAAGAVEILENIRLFLGQPDLLFVRGQQQFHRRTELIGADLENSILALLMAAKMGPDPGQQDGELERLSDIVIRTGLKAEDLVGIGVLAREHDDRSRNAVLAHQAARVAPVHIRQFNIEKDEIGTLITGRGHAAAGGLGGQSAEFLVQGKLLDKGFTEVFVIIDDQDGFLRVHALIMPISLHKAIPAAWQNLPGRFCWSGRFFPAVAGR